MGGGGLVYIYIVLVYIEVAACEDTHTKCPNGPSPNILCTQIPGQSNIIGMTLVYTTPLILSSIFCTTLNI